jgi:lipoic acid synthetase
MILGNTCTRRCAFCGVSKGHPSPPDPEEPRRVAEAVQELGLAHAVITSVTRDDLADGGASCFSAAVRRLREIVPDAAVELLTPDFNGNTAAIECVLSAKPDVFGHNLETVPGLYSEVRPGADYRRSLALLKKARSAGLRTKTGLMLGLGETREALRAVFFDLSEIGCGILTLGQYLRPDRQSRPVAEYVPPERFESIRLEALQCGIRRVIAGPRVRSSYRAAEAALQD